MLWINKIQKVERLVAARPRKKQAWRDRLKFSLLVAALVLPIATVKPFPAGAEEAVLEPVQDAEINLLLERYFTLPMALANGVPSVQERGKLIAAEVTKLTALLAEQGYLGAWIRTSGSGATEDPLRLQPEPGPLYRIGEIRIIGLPTIPDDSFGEAIEALLVRQKAVPAQRSVVEALSRAILYELQERSYASAVLQDFTFDLDPQAAVADVVVTVNPGSPTRFGRVVFRGSLRMDQAEAQALVPFEQGAAYSLTAIETLRSALDQTGAFRRIRIDEEAVTDAPGEVNLSVRLWDKAAPLQAGMQPRILIATILLLAVIQMVRVTRHWSDRDLRILLMFTAVLFLSGSAVEVTNLLYLFLYN